MKYAARSVLGGIFVLSVWSCVRQGSAQASCSGSNKHTSQQRGKSGQLLDRWHPVYHCFSHTCRNFEPSHVYYSEPQELREPPEMSRNMSCGKRISQIPTYKSKDTRAHVTRETGSCCGVPHFHCKHTILVFDFVTPVHRTHQPPCTVNYSSYSIATACTCDEFRFSCYSSHRPEKPPITPASFTAKDFQVSGMEPPASQQHDWLKVC